MTKPSREPAASFPCEYCRIARVRTAPGRLVLLHLLVPPLPSLAELSAAVNPVMTKAPSQFPPTRGHLTTPTNKFVTGSTSVLRSLAVGVVGVCDSAVLQSVSRILRGEKGRLNLGVTDPASRRHVLNPTGSLGCEMSDFRAAARNFARNFPTWMLEGFHDHVTRNHFLYTSE